MKISTIFLVIKSNPKTKSLQFCDWIDEITNGFSNISVIFILEQSAWTVAGFVLEVLENIVGQTVLMLDHIVGDVVIGIWTWLRSLRGGVLGKFEFSNGGISVVKTSDATQCGGRTELVRDKGRERMDGIGGNSTCDVGIESRSSKRTELATVYETWLKLEEVKSIRLVRRTVQRRRKANKKLLAKKPFVKTNFRSTQPEKSHPNQFQ